MIRHVPQADLRHPIEPLTLPPSPEPESSRATSAPPSDTLALLLLAVLGEELRLSPEHIRGVVERELPRLRSGQRLTVHVHPDDLALLETSDSYRARCELGSPPTLRADPQIERGGALLTSELGEVDARLETRLRCVLALWKQGALSP